MNQPDKNMTLLDKASQIKTRNHNKSASDEDFELALAWLKEDIGVTQIAFAKFGNKKATASVYNYLTMVFREAYKKGKLKIL